MQRVHGIVEVSYVEYNKLSYLQRKSKQKIRKVIKIDFRENVLKERKLVS